MSNGIPEGSPYDSVNSIRIEPVFESYQLLGDSQFLRFSEQILHESRKKWKGYAYLGLCVSGQKTCDLLHRVERKFHPLSKKVILMVGTNDLLQGTNSVQLRATFEKLVLALMGKKRGNVERLIVLTVPPVPRLRNSPQHWKTLKMLNNQIKDLHNGKDIIVIDTYPKFIKNDGLSRSSPSLSRNSLSPSRSSLVSYSSDISSPSLRNSSNTINIPCFTSNFGKIRTNLRIEVEDVNDRIDKSNRTIYLKGSDSDSSSDDEDNSDLSTYLTPSCKRIRPSSGFSSPNPKRKSLSSGSHDISLDDHNDGFYLNDAPEAEEQFEKINEEYFEKFFDKQGSREDLIHLNINGLRLIRSSILDVIHAW